MPVLGHFTSVGDFVGRGRKIPATGFSFGLEPITEALKQKITILKKTPTNVYIIPIGTTLECMKIVKMLRSKGINADIDLSKRGISKNLNYANSLDIPYVLFVGDEELNQGKVKLRDMKSGNEEMIAIDEVASKLL